MSVRLSIACLLVVGCGESHIVSPYDGTVPPPLTDGGVAQRDIRWRPDARPVPDGWRSYCITHSDCPASMVCDVHSCYGGSGVCRPRPASCPSIWAPVCGCNHQTYASDCHRLAAGEPLKYQGACAAVMDAGLPPPPPIDAAVPMCGPNGKCPAGMVCNVTSCYPGAPGSCVPKPPSCPTVWVPVCGCDGVTYTNDCFRVSYSAPLAHPGTCSTPPVPDQGVIWPPDVGLPPKCPPGVIFTCFSNGYCPTGYYCVNGCCIKPPPPPPPPPPIDAGYPDAPIPPPGCGPFPGGQCPAGMVCNITSCYPGASGTCVPKPAACPLLWSPACGCDGVTYTNDCYRLFYSASLAHPGSCATPVVDQGYVWPDGGWPWP